jgi:MFS family permease
MVLSGVLFTLSIPLIALADGYMPLLLGRLLQGISGGLIGVVVPLYLAECLHARQRGRGAALFQLLLTIGLVAAAVIGLMQAHSVESATAAAQRCRRPRRGVRRQGPRLAQHLLVVPDAGPVFTVGSLLLAESPRWLARRGRIEEARTALLRTRPADEAEAELREIQQALAPASAAAGAPAASDPLLSRRYVLPFLLACLVLALNQATGINSVLAYVVNILNQAGLPGATANTADVALKVLNALMTIVAVVLVDRKGRKFLLMLGTGGIVTALLAAGLLFRSAEGGQRDVRPLQARIQSDSVSLRLDAATLQSLGVNRGAPQQLTVAYSYGPFTNVQTRRSDDAALPVLRMSREDTVQPDSVIGAFFRKLHLNPFADPAEGLNAPLRIERADIAAVPPPRMAGGWRWPCACSSPALRSAPACACGWRCRS